MSNEITNNAPVNTETAQVEPTLSPYATNAMRPVIVQKAIDGVRRAITPKMCEDAGVDEKSLEAWKYNVYSLYEAAVEYSKAVGTDEEAEREQEVWNVWRTIIKAGEEDRFHPNMFVRRKDVENIRVLAAESDEVHIRGVGFVPTLKGREAFRSRIEIRLACRIAANKTLNDRQREVIKAYKGAERKIKSAEELINGYTRGNITVSGLATKIAGAEKELEQAEKVLKDAGIADIEPLTRKLKNDLKSLKAQKTTAEKRIKDAKKVITDNQTAYDEIIAGLDAIEDVPSVQKPVPTAEMLKEQAMADLAKDLAE